MTHNIFKLQHDTHFLDLGPLYTTVEKSRGILKFDWRRVTFLFGGGLHCHQESYGGELCTWMKK